MRHTLIKPQAEILKYRMFSFDLTVLLLFRRCKKKLERELVCLYNASGLLKIELSTLEAQFLGFY